MLDRKIKSERQGTDFNRGSWIMDPWPRPGLPRSSYGRPDMEEQQKQGIIQSTSRQGGHESSIVNPKGFTLIEIIIFIVVAGIILPVILVPFATSVKESLTPEKVAKASYLAQQKMEELTKNAYDSVQTETQPYTAITGFPNYQWLWDVTWIDDTLNSSPSDVGYKLILVRVQDTDNREIELETVVTRRPGDE